MSYKELSDEEYKNLDIALDDWELTKDIFLCSDGGEDAKSNLKKGKDKLKQRLGLKKC